MHISREEIAEELEQIANDNPDENDRAEATADYVEMVVRNYESIIKEQNSPEGQVDRDGFLIDIFECLACAANEVSGDPNRDLLFKRMAPHITKWLLEDYNIYSK